MDNTDKDNLLRQLQADITDLRLRFLNQEETKKEKKKFLNSANGPILVALIGIFGAIMLNYIQQNANNKLEQQKLKSTLILKALDAGDTSKVSKTLLWFVKNKLIEDKDSVITKAANNPTDLPVFAFNVQANDLPTLMVTNSSQNGGGCKEGFGVGCWKPSITANAGDTIAVQVYFHNPTEYLAEDVTLSIQPIFSPKGTLHTFVGGVASTTIPRSNGYATVTTTTEQSISFIPGSERMYKHGVGGAYSVSKPDSLFSSHGLSIGNVSPGWDNQGVLVAQFVVSKN